VKQEAWDKNKFDEVFTKKQNDEYVPTVNTHVNIIKNKLPDVFTKKGRFEKADMTTLIGCLYCALRSSWMIFLRPSWIFLRSSFFPFFF
jgi:hypothetical protein